MEFQYRHAGNSWNYKASGVNSIVNLQELKWDIGSKKSKDGMNATQWFKKWEWTKHDICSVK